MVHLFPLRLLLGTSTQIWTAPVDFGTNPTVRIWTALSQGPGIFKVNGISISVDAIAENGWTTVAVTRS